MTRTRAARDHDGAAILTAREALTARARPTSPPPPGVAAAINSPQGSSADYERRSALEPLEARDDIRGRLAFSVEEAALITGLSRDLLYDQMRAGKLVYLKVGRRRIITRQNLEAFLGSGA
jgi:excisionase family DNA binding protein